MPKYTSLSSRSANIWLWQLTESSEQLLALLPTHLDYASQVQQFRSMQRQREWLATRLLMHDILGDNIGIAYNEHGAPFLVSKEGYASLEDIRFKPNEKRVFPTLSISHSHQWVAIALGTNLQPIGLDLEVISEKAARVQHKFLSAEEQRLLSPTFTPTALWCAKEATYKLCNHPGLLFLDQMRLYNKEGQIMVELPTLQRDVLIEAGRFMDCAFAVAQFAE